MAETEQMTVLEAAEAVEAEEEEEETTTTMITIHMTVVVVEAVARARVSFLMWREATISDKPSHRVCLPPAGEQTTLVNSFPLKLTEVEAEADEEEEDLVHFPAELHLQSHP